MVERLSWSDPYRPFARSARVCTDDLNCEPGNCGIPKAVDALSAFELELQISLSRSMFRVPKTPRTALDWSRSYAAVLAA
jgi:hypothetical protein